MTKNAGAFAVNDRINHSVYGLGTIAEVNPQHTTIVFDGAGRKKFLTSVVQLEHSSTPAPVRASRTREKKTAKAAK